MMEIALTPGVVPIGLVNMTANTFTPASEYCNMSKYVWVPGVIWAEAGATSQSIAFNNIGLVKNIVPMVRCLDGELIIPNEYGISIAPSAVNEIYMCRRDNTYVCKRPSTGASVLAAAVDSMGVMVEI
jgi:hypothetical protein